MFIHIYKRTYVHVYTHIDEYIGGGKEYHLSQPSPSPAHHTTQQHNSN